ncbi:MAG: addiction module toxin RelE [Gammaproteobacteria bacterium]|nr:addiction module toxin RelE [Gammaproteobacteria bacterium]
MARPLRLELKNGLYHVTSRGDGREDIYVDDEDKNAWLKIFGASCQRYNWRCYAYCLMDNHYHIVVETAEPNLSKGMRHLNGVYTQAYNRRHNRVGRVFQGRFKGILVDKDEYLLELARYVVLNPIRAGMTKTIYAWRWSSYRAMLGKAEAPVWLETDWTLSYFGKRRKNAIKKYQEFVREGIGLPSIWGNLKKQIFLGSDKFITKYQKLIDGKTKLAEMPLLQKRAVVHSLIGYERRYKNRNDAISAAFGSGGYTLKELAEHFGCHYSTISRIVKTSENID